MDEEQPGAHAAPKSSTAVNSGGAPRSGAMGTIIIGLVIGLSIAGAVLFFGRGGDEAAPPPTVDTPTTTPTTTPTSPDEPAERNGDAVDLIVAYGRNLTEDHALRGEILRPGSDPLPVRRAIMGSRGIDEVGATAAVTQDGQTRQCELIDGEWLCARPLPEITADFNVQGFATLLLTEQPTYAVFAVSSEPPDPLASITSFGPVTCWSIVSDGRVDRARFGAETTMCFHDELGAMVGQITETSAGDDIFLADDLRADVDVADVEPSR